MADEDQWRTQLIVDYQGLVPKVIKSLRRKWPMVNQSAIDAELTGRTALMDAARRFNGSSPFDSYAKKAIYNAILQVIRKHYKRITAAEGRLPVIPTHVRVRAAEAAQNSKSYGLDPEMCLFHPKPKDSGPLKEALDSLHPDLRLIVDLKFGLSGLQLSSAEVAAQTGLTRRKVDDLLHQAIGLLRSEMA